MELGFPFSPNHPIKIRPSANMGFIIKIGCGEFVATNVIELINIGKQYLADPAKWEKEYNKLPGNPQEVATPDPGAPTGEPNQAEA